MEIDMTYSGERVAIDFHVETNSATAPVNASHLAWAAGLRLHPVDRRGARVADGVLYYDRMAWPVAQQWLIARELARLLLLERGCTEAWVDDVAAALMLPQDLMLAELDAGKTAEEIADTQPHVSSATVAKRLNRLRRPVLRAVSGL